MRLRSAAVAVLLPALLAAGCSSHRINFQGPAVPIEYGGKRSLAVSVLDQRPYVLDRSKPLNYAGTIRGGYGNPFNLYTDSGDPLAQEFLRTVAQALQAKGFSVKPLPRDLGDTRKIALDGLRASGSDRLLLVTIREWQNDYYPASYGKENSYVLFNVELEVLNAKGQVAAKKTVQGENHLPSGWPNATVPPFYRQKIGELLNDPKVAASIK